jgi:hypothetical protein
LAANQIAAVIATLNLGSGDAETGQGVWKRGIVRRRTRAAAGQQDQNGDREWEYAFHVYSSVCVRRAMARTPPCVEFA